MRRRIGGLRLADVRPQLAVPDLGHEHLADRPGVQQLHRPPHVLRAAPLRADLHHAVVAPRGLDHQPALADVVSTGFLDVDVLAGIAGENRGRRVPVVGRGDDDRIHGAIVEDPPHVFVGPGGLAGGALDGLRGRAHPVGIRIADIRHLDILLGGKRFEQPGPLPAGADHTEDDAVIRPGGPRLRHPERSRADHCSAGLPQELASICG